jgi:transmembrane sensor
MRTGKSTQISGQILGEACDWFIDFNEGELDAAARERFNKWLRRSPEHVRAYVEIAVAWEDSSRLNDTQRLDPKALVAEALVESNVVPIEPRATEPSAAEAASEMTAHREGAAIAWSGELSSAPQQYAHRRAGGKRLAWLLFAVAASVLLAVGIGFLTQRSAYTTGIGEQRSIALDDGSTVELNARSRLRVRFSHAERLVDLIDGQALFRVKKDAARPFIVLSNGTRVRAVGTQFDVYRKTTATTVTVVEGRVAVTGVPAPIPAGGSSETSGGGGSEAPIFLSAGEQVTLAPQITPHAVRVNMADAIAWTQKKLVFDETPLSEAVAEFNRYNSRQMIIEDALLAEYHIRGHFEADDPDRLIQLLRDRFDANVREHGNEIRISRK